MPRVRVSAAASLLDLGLVTSCLSTPLGGGHGPVLPPGAGGTRPRSWRGSRRGETGSVWLLLASGSDLRERAGSGALETRV